MTQFPSQFPLSQFLQPHTEDGARVLEYHMLLFYEDELDVVKSHGTKHVASTRIPVQNDQDSATWSSKLLFTSFADPIA
jgi:hypothetical protein